MSDKSLCNTTMFRLHFLKPRPMARLLRVADGQLFEQLDVAKVSPFIVEKHELDGFLLSRLILPGSVVCEDF